MHLRRRQLLASAGLVVATTSAGCSNALGLSNEVRVNFSGNVHSGEALVRDAGLSIGDGYPHHYVRLVTSKQEEATDIRWDYIDSELPLLTNDLEGTDYESSFLLFFGMVLPRTKYLQPTSPTKIEDNTLHTAYRIEHGGGGSTELAVNTAMIRVIHDETPENTEISLQLG